MKKIATLGALIALTSSSAFAENDFYVKAAALGGMGHKLFEDDKEIVKGGTKISKDVNKFGNFHFGGELAFGYKIMDNVRVELQGYYLNGPNFKYDLAKDDKDKDNKDDNSKNSEDDKGKDPKAKKDKDAKDAKDSKDNNSSKVSKDEVKVETSGPAVMIGGAVDIVSFGQASLYGTFGVGMSYMNVKITGDIEGKNEKGEDDKNKQELEWEAKVRLAFNVGAGVSFAVSDSVNIDAGYSFMSLGKPQKDDFKAKDNKDKKEDKKDDKKDDNKIDWAGNSLISHTVKVGVRFSF